MSKAVRIHEVGGPEVLRFEAVEVKGPGPGEAVLKQAAAGLNDIDTYQRSGLYPLATLPVVLGMEGAGVLPPPPPHGNIKEPGTLGTRMTSTHQQAGIT